MTDLQTFREETRDWLEANCPPEMRKPGDVAWGGRNAQFSHPDQNYGLIEWAKRVGPALPGLVSTVEVDFLKKKTKFSKKKWGQ